MESGAYSKKSDLSKVKWKNCNLREWLNKDFYKTFSKKEQANIATTHVENTDGDTEDKIYLLSVEEAEQYFANDSERSTGYWWWLRSTGKEGGLAALVSQGGDIDYDGYRMNATNGDIHPVLWLEWE